MPGAKMDFYKANHICSLHMPQTSKPNAFLHNFATVLILIEEFRKGELKGGDRQSCFQMEQSLRVKFSSNVANWVDRYSIQSWLSTYIDRRKKENDPLYQWEVRRKQVTSTMMRTVAAVAAGAAGAAGAAVVVGAVVQ